jgi:DNA polymerase-3 subunit gamma/tau
VFENIIAQDAVLQLAEDIPAGRLAPSMLFFGPAASGKGSAALELARVLSCENRALWNCPCPACARHRYLIHADLLSLGSRPFAAEIAASAAAFSREPSSAATRLLFIRSVRKLLSRFSPVLWEDDSKLGKISPLLQSLEEELDEFEAESGRMPEDSGGAASPPEKLISVILKNAFKLEDEGVGDVIPVAQIRRAAYWGRLAPNGRRKVLLIENADRMQEGARNSLLKILEEPPASLSIVLSSQRREAIMPTILSRLRPYRFLKRDGEREREIIRRVFRDSAGHIAGNLPAGDKRAGADQAPAGLISAYLDSFLPQPLEKLYPLAAFFIASVARMAAMSLKKKGASAIPADLAALGAHCAPIAEDAGFGRALNARDVIAAVLSSSSNFEARSFPRFLRQILDLVSHVYREEAGPHFIAQNDIWRKYTARAEAAAGVWNQSPALALEALFYRLKETLCEARLDTD